MNECIRRYIQTHLPQTVHACSQDEGTLLALPFPYTVPCVGEMFQELYYWDTYFTNLGLLALGETSLAKNNLDNILWLIDRYGFMPNGNRTYYLNRSQPPFAAFMVRDLYEVCPDETWLKDAYETLAKEYAFWQEHKVTSCGLNAYTNYRIADEDVDFLCAHFEQRTRLPLSPSMTLEEKRDICQATFSFFESGWDCNSRFLREGHRMMAVDLNSLLYGTERCMAQFAAVVCPNETALWETRAQKRRDAMKRLLWNASAGLFLDRHESTAQFAAYRTVASFYPLFTRLATAEEAAKAVSLLDALLTPYGVTAGEKRGSGGCQWDHPNIWAPLQWITYVALKNYGYTEKAQTVAENYCRLIERCFEETGNFWEKYDGIRGTVATNEYDAPPMMGWTVGVYVRFCKERGNL